MGRLALHWQILIGMAAGIAAGVLLNATGDAIWAAAGVTDGTAYLSGEAAPGASLLAPVLAFVANATTFVGDLFLRGLKFIAVPIVLFSLVVGASSLDDLTKLSRIGGKTVGIYLGTTAVAISIGLGLALVIKPGSFVSAETRDQLAGAGAEAAAAKIASATPPSVWQVMLDIVPTNPFQAIAQGNMLQVVFFAMAVGVALTLLPAEKSRPVIQLFDALSDVIIKLVEGIMKTAPFAVFCLLAPVVASLGTDVLAALLIYSLTVVAGLGLMIFGVYPLVLRVMTPVGYRRFFTGMAPAQLLAFSSSSSSATLPVTMECCEERIGVSDEVTAFVLPVGATINMDGTALYQGVAAVFIAQLYGIQLGLGDLLSIVLTATLASVGTAGVPGVGIVMLVIVLQTAGIPLDGIAVILGVDRLLDMCRTVCNVTGDAMVCTVIGHSEGALADEATLARRRVAGERPPEAV